MTGGTRAADDAARQAVRQARRGSFVVRGAPGTGRSTLLSDRAAWIAEHGYGGVLHCTASSVHQMARSLLEEAGALVGVPLGFEVLDAAAARCAMERWSDALLRSLLDDTDLAQVLARGLTLGLHGRHLAGAALALDACREQLDATTLMSLDAAMGASRLDTVDATPVIEALERAIAWAVRCDDEDDLLRGHLHGRLAESRTALAAAQGDEAAVLGLLVRLPSFGSALGRQERWSGCVGDVRAACAAAEVTRRQVLEGAGAPVVHTLLARLAAEVSLEARTRVAEGHLTRHDVVVEAARLLRDHSEVRALVRRRWAHLLVDDLGGCPSVEGALVRLLADAIAGGGPDEEGGGGCGEQVAGRSAVFVADPAGDGPIPVDTASTQVVLEANQRAVPGLLAFTAAVSAALLPTSPWPPAHATRSEHQSARGAGTGVQLCFAGLGDDEGPASVLELPSVVALGGATEVSPAQLRWARARAAAQAAAQAVSEGWPVTEPKGGESAGARPARWGDVAVAIAGPDALAQLEEAFVEAAVPYRVADPALLWATDDVADLLAVLAAVEDPADEVAVLGALRTPGLACGDDDLLVWHRGGGSWDPLGPAPAGLDGHPVAEALAVVARLHRARWWTAPGDLVLDALDALHASELALARPRPEEHWRRLAWLGAQARRFDTAPGATLGGFLRWAEGQRRGTVDDRGPWPMADEEEAVLVLTLDAAERREFPVLILAGLEGPWAPADALAWHGGAPCVRFGPLLRSAGYDEAVGAERARAEAARRVALLRALHAARDHVVVCLHHRSRDGTSEPGLAAEVAEVCRAHPLLWRRLPDPDDGRRRQMSGRGPTAPAAGGGPRRVDAAAWDLELATFAAARAALLSAATSPSPP